MDIVYTWGPKGSPYTNYGAQVYTEWLHGLFGIFFSIVAVRTHLACAQFGTAAYIRGSIEGYIYHYIIIINGSL